MYVDRRTDLWHGSGHGSLWNVPIINCNDINLLRYALENYIGILTDQLNSTQEERTPRGFPAGIAFFGNQWIVHIWRGDLESVENIMC